MHLVIFRRPSVNTPLTQRDDSRKSYQITSIDFKAMDSGRDRSDEIDYYCDCKRLVTVSALCKQEPIVLAPHLGALKRSAEEQDACPFCVLCWSAISQKYPNHAERWAKESLKSKGKDDLKLVPRGEWTSGITVTADFKFQGEVRTADGRLLKGPERDRSPDSRAIQQPQIQSYADSVIGIHMRQRHVVGPSLRIFA